MINEMRRIIGENLWLKIGLLALLVLVVYSFAALR